MSMTMGIKQQWLLTLILKLLPALLIMIYFLSTGKIPFAEEMGITLPETISISTLKYAFIAVLIFSFFFYYFLYYCAYKNNDSIFLGITMIIEVYDSIVNIHKNMLGASMQQNIFLAIKVALSILYLITSYRLIKLNRSLSKKA
jgi:hypothetical protein